jgi:Eco57I restriction-modification methylase
VKRARGSSGECASTSERVALARERAQTAAEILLDAIDHADRARGGEPLEALSDAALYSALLAALLGLVFVQQAERRGLIEATCLGALARRAAIGERVGGRLLGFALPFADLVDEASFERARRALTAEEPGPGDPPLELLGQLYESLVGYGIERAAGVRRLARGKARKRSGSFYTPRELTEPSVARALERIIGAAESDDPEHAAGRLGALSVCDPALGGGAFLLEALRQLGNALARAWQRAGRAADPRAACRIVATRCLHGVDSSELAVAIAEASLWLAVGDPGLPMRAFGVHLAHGDALLGPGANPARDGQLALWHSDAPGAPALDWRRVFPEVFGECGGFDVVVGNPPWVAFAGRAAQQIEPALRARYVATYSAMRGYPTLHGMFVERAAELAPDGTIALLLPSPIADLDGYRAVRRAVSARHVVREPLLEFGQDAFESVVQPCFLLVADPDARATESDRAWTLSERQRAGNAAVAVSAPELLTLLGGAPTLPAELFREMGFQSSGAVSRTLFLRAPEPDALHRYPLLEGRDVFEFRQGEPRLYLRADPELLRQAGARLRAAEDYRRVGFVVRQTAKMPIAALHRGLPFRNSLLAGLNADGISAELAVALLNSALYRALHLAARRDARQAAFPQVKLAHLRSLPRPPACAELRDRVAALTRRATSSGVSRELRRELDDAVFDLFAVPEDHRRAVLGWLAERVPALYPPLDAPAPSSSLAPVRARLEA